MKSNRSGGRKAALGHDQQKQQQDHSHHPSNIRVDPEAVPTTSEISAVTLPSASGSAVSLDDGDDSKEASSMGDVEQGRRPGRRSGENAYSSHQTRHINMPGPDSHLHGQALHQEAMIVGAAERSIATIPSAGTTPERVDNEGQSLLHRGGGCYGGGGYGGGGGGGSSGGVYRSFGTMEDVSGASSFVVDGNGGGTATAGSSARSGRDRLTNNVQDDTCNLFAASVDAEQTESSRSQQSEKALQKRKKVGFSFTSSAIPGDDEVEALQGQQQQQQQHQRQTSRTLSIFGSIFGPSNHAGTDGDGMDEEGLLGAVQEDEVNEPPPNRRRGWSVLRNREKSIILFGQRLVSLDDDSDEDDDDDDDDDDRNMKSEASSATGDPSTSERSAKDKESTRKARQKEKLLERASTAQQRFNVSVKECTAAIVAYLALSVLAYSFIFEDWPMVDSLYFGVVTFTAVGYGDLVPSTDSGRLFCIIYALGGCAALGIALGVLGDTMVQSELSTIRKLKLKRQRKVMSSIEKDRELIASQRTQGEDRSIPQLQFIVRIPIVTAIILCATFITIREGWYWTNGIYYTIVTMCTIGYGDYAPEHHHSRALAVIFIPCSVALLGALLARIASAVINKRQARFRDELIHFNLTPDMFECMDSSDNGHVTKADYINFMLLAMKAVDRELLDALNQQFERLDETNTGDLTIDDLKANLEKSLRNVRKKLELSKYKREMLAKGGSDKSMTESIRFGSKS